MDQRRRESDSATRPAAARATPTAATPTVMPAAPPVSGSTPSVAPAAVRDSTTALATAISAHAGNATLLRQVRPGRARSVQAIATLATSQLATAAAIAMSVPHRAWTRRNAGRTAAVSAAAASTMADSCVSSRNRRVVDAVAGHGHGLPPVREDRDEPQLVLGRGPGDDGLAAQPLGELVVVDRVERRAAVHDLGGVDPGLAGGRR